MTILVPRERSAARPLPERLRRRTRWRLVLLVAIILLLVFAAVALLLLRDGSAVGYVALAAVIAMVALVWMAVRIVSVCPGCLHRIQRSEVNHCPRCGMHLSSGRPAPDLVSADSGEASPLLECPGCHQAPGGTGRYGTRYPSEGFYCSSCGTRLFRHA